MGDDPRKNLKWLEQELLAAERPARYVDETDELLAKVDALLEEEPEPPAFVQKRKKQTKGERAERVHIRQQFDESAAVLTKTRRQLRREAKLQRRKAKQQKKLEKKASVNHNLKDLVVLAVLEIIGILCILGWWLQ